MPVLSLVELVPSLTIAPAAAAVDEEARCPDEALAETDFYAPHVPEEYGGVGADALATVIVIEEVARVDVSASLIPAVNKAGSMPVRVCGRLAVEGWAIATWGVLPNQLPFSSSASITMMPLGPRT